MASRSSEQQLKRTDLVPADGGAWLHALWDQLPWEDMRVLCPGRFRLCKNVGAFETPCQLISRCLLACNVSTAPGNGEAVLHDASESTSAAVHRRLHPDASSHDDDRAMVGSKADPTIVIPFPDGGGLMTYVLMQNGQVRYVHTLNTRRGLSRKLEDLQAGEGSTGLSRKLEDLQGACEAAVSGGDETQREQALISRLNQQVEALKSLHCRLCGIDSAARRQVPAVLDAAAQVPHLSEARQARKSALDTLDHLSRDDNIARILHATTADWTGALIHFAATHRVLSEKRWSELARSHLTSFSLGASTQSGMFEVLQRSDAASVHSLLQKWLEVKLINAQHHAWQQGLLSRSGAIPLFEEQLNVLVESPERTHASFDCVIVEPFNPLWDPTFLLTPVGSRRIGDALWNLETAARSYDVSSLEALHQSTVQQQAALKDIQGEVVQTLKEFLVPVLLSLGVKLDGVEPFGSLEIGTATVSSDIDVNVLAPCGLPPQALVKHVKDALENSGASWVLTNSVSEVLQTQKVPIVSFNFIFEVGREIPGSHQLHHALQRLGIQSEDSAVTTLRSVPVDISFNNAVAAEETNFYCKTVNSDSSNSALTLLSFFKHWSKSSGCNEPRAGTLSSFGWRHIILSILMEIRLVAAPHCENANEKSQDVYSLKSALTHCIDELLCISRSAKTHRVFQLLTLNPVHDLDDIFMQRMSQISLPPSLPIYQHKTKHIGVLALPHGSRKSEICAGVAARFSLGCIVIEWNSTGPDSWPLFVAQLADALNTDVKIVLVKIVPDREKIMKLSMFLNNTDGNVFIFHQQPNRQTPAVEESARQLLCQLTRVITSNIRNIRQQESPMFIPSTEDGAIWPPWNNYQTWASQIWGEGVNVVFTRLASKSKKIDTLLKRCRESPRVVCVPIKFYEHALNDDDGGEDVRAMCNCCEKRKAAVEKRELVFKVMNYVTEGSALQFETDTADIVDSIVDYFQSLPE